MSENAEHPEDPAIEVVVVEDDSVGADATLGGYFATHDRPPAFEGSDGHPYTVSIEVERTDNLAAPFAGYLVFPKWAETGLGIVGHVETDILWEARGSEAIRELAGDLDLAEVKGLLDKAIERRTRIED